MTLAQLIQGIRMPRRRGETGNTARCRRWRQKHRARWNAYRRAWRASRKGGA